MKSELQGSQAVPEVVVSSRLAGHPASGERIRRQCHPRRRQRICRGSDELILFLSVVISPPSCSAGCVDLSTRCSISNSLFLFLSLHLLFFLSVMICHDITLWISKAVTVTDIAQCQQLKINCLVRLILASFFDPRCQGNEPGWNVAWMACSIRAI